MIQFEDGKWVIYSRDGRVLGEYRSRAAAAERLRQIEAFKHRESEKDK